MLLRKSLAWHPTALIRIGLVFMVLANLWKLVVRVGPHLPGSVADSVGGFLYGITIATLIIGIRLKARRRASGSG